MTWEEKLQALCALCLTSLRMREPGNWYVEAIGRDVRRGCALTGEYGNGTTPQEAVEDDWRKIAESKNLITIDGGFQSEKQYRWNGFM